MALWAVVYAKLLYFTKEDILSNLGCSVTTSARIASGRVDDFLRIGGKQRYLKALWKTYHCWARMNVYMFRLERFLALRRSVHMRTSRGWLLLFLPWEMARFCKRKKGRATQVRRRAVARDALCSRCTLFEVGLWVPGRKVDKGNVREWSSRLLTINFFCIGSLWSE